MTDYTPADLDELFGDDWDTRAAFVDAFRTAHTPTHPYPEEPVNDTPPATDTAPSNRYAAADWLAGRHQRVMRLAERLGAADPAAGDTGFDPDVIAQAVYEHDAHAALWQLYEAQHPAPGPYDEHESPAYDEWEQAGPKATARAAAFGVMSSGEKAIVRLLATLGELDRDDSPYTLGELDRDALTGRPLWWIGDVTSYDHAGALILADWLAIVRAQLPEQLYAGPPLPPANWIDTGTGPGYVAS